MESQKRQADTPDGRIAPHRKHVLVTGCFALRTHPLRRGENSSRISRPIYEARKENKMWLIGQQKIDVILEKLR
jgi:hypothetical protein